MRCYVRLELKGYLSEASKELTNEVKTWAGSAWASFNRVLKSKLQPVASEATTQEEPQSTAQAAPTTTTKAEQAVKAHFGPLNGGAHVDHVLQVRSAHISLLSSCRAPRTAPITRSSCRNRRIRLKSSTSSSFLSARTPPTGNRRTQSCSCSTASTPRISHTCFFRVSSFALSDF
eukprot:m.808140 g.808140  ORF g.808140 m.808140 type:complete len:175 (+) comp59309_c0_seq21:2049-2573(+)